jgi:hypothetical protein
MYVGPSQSVFLLVLFTGFMGMWRGWVREIITLAITLGSVLFLLNGGIIWLWRFIFYIIPGAFKYLFQGSSGVNWDSSFNDYNPSLPDPYGHFWLLLSFILTVGLGFLIGHKYGTKPTLFVNRLVGAILGAINGIVIMFYATKQLAWGNSITVVTPDSWQSQLGMLSALGCGLGLLAVVMFITFGTRGGGGGH